MGTYTANKELYMPTVGEQGWGTLMNGNLETIDTFLKPITVSGSTYTFTGNQTGGTLTATKITNSGTLTNTGKITANGGIGTTTLTASSTSTFTGKITANGGIGTKALTTTSISNSGKLTQTGTSTFTGKITANGGVNDYEERITALEAGEFEGNVSAETFNGDLWVNVSTQDDPSVGSYTVTVDTDTVSASGWTDYAPINLTTGKITIINIEKSTKKGFKFDDTIRIALSFSASGFSAAKLTIYLNDEEFYVGSNVGSTTFEYIPSIGDVLYATIKSGYASNMSKGVSYSLKLSNPSAKWYIA